MEDLSIRQKQVLLFVTSQIDEHGYPPTLREIASHLGIVGNPAVLGHLDALERKGYIRREPGSSRGIVLTRGRPRSEMVSIPIAGVVRAGLPALAFEEIEGYYLLDRMQLKGGSFFLRVKGESMIGDAILEEDLVLIRPQSTAVNGDIVVAMVEGEATLKRFYRERGRIRLQPANPEMEPIYISEGEEIAIIGKVVKVIREL